jgi:hypothetical protein
LLGHISIAQTISSNPYSATNVPYEDKDSAFYAQDSINGITPSIELGTEYANKILFWGRDFGIQQFGVQPYAIFKTGKGFYFYGSQYYWSGLANPWAKTDIGVGYEKQVTDRLYLSGGYERWIFYNGNSHDRHGLQNYFELQVNYDFGLFMIEPTIYYMTGNRNIFQADLMIKGDYQLFVFLKKGRVFFQPEILMTSATSTYFAAGLGSSNTVQSQNGKFKIVDYELMLPLSFNLNNTDLKLAYHFACPIAINASESVHTTSYLTVSLSRNFYFKKNK